MDDSESQTLGFRPVVFLYEIVLLQGVQQGVALALMDAYLVAYLRQCQLGFRILRKVHQ